MRLSGDSASDITDLSREGILTSTLQDLPKAEQALVSKYNEKFRKLLNRSKRHDCYKVDRRNKSLKNDLRDVVQMELKAISEPKEYDDFEQSAHQFSVRDKSLQADSEERAEIAMQTSIIDLKSHDQQVDVYELLNMRDGSTQLPASVQTNFLKGFNDIF